MLQVRITFVEKQEADKLIKDIEKQYDVLSQSKVYKGRGNSKYSNVYLHVADKSHTTK